MADVGRQIDNRSCRLKVSQPSRPLSHLQIWSERDSNDPLICLVFRKHNRFQIRRSLGRRSRLKYARDHGAMVRHAIMLCYLQRITRCGSECIVVGRKCAPRKYIFGCNVSIRIPVLAYPPEGPWRYGGHSAYESSCLTQRTSFQMLTPHLGSSVEFSVPLWWAKMPLVESIA